MSKLNELRVQLKNKATECRRILDNTPQDKALSSSDQSKYDDLTLEINVLSDKIEKEQNYLNMISDDHFKQYENEPRDLPGDKSRSMFKSWLKNGESGLNQEEKAAFLNTMSTTTGSEGGFTVPAQVSSNLISLLKHYSSMRQSVEVFTTESGVDISYPTSDGTSEEGEFIAENAASSDGDLSFGTASLRVYLCSSKKVAVPFALLQDSAIDIEQLVNGRCAERIGRISNKKFTLGTGTNEPFGIVTRATVGKILSTGKSTSFDYDDLVDVQESVDAAYAEANRGKWMFNQTVRRSLRKLKDSNGRPIWTPGYELGATAGIPDLLLGSEVKINNDMPAPAANAKSILFGDLKKYMIRDAMSISFFRFADSAFISKGQIGFMAFVRTGGNLIDVTAVKTMQHSAT